MAIAVAFTAREDILNLGTVGQWTTITLPNVPAGATGVIVEFYGDTNTNNAQGAIRTIGCGLDGSNAYQLGTSGSGQMIHHAQHWADMNASNQVEMWINAHCIAARIAGWLEAGDVNFLPTCEDMWPYLESGDGATPDTDHVFNLSAISGGASAVLVSNRGATIDGNSTYNWKRPAESYWRDNTRRGATSADFVYPLDGSGKLTMKFSHYTQSLVVLGFMGSNFTPYTTAPESTTIPDASWSDVTLVNTSGTATVAIVDLDAGPSVWGGVQQRGEPDRPVPDFAGFGNQYFVGLDGSKRYEHMCVDAVHETIQSHCIGWFDPASAPTTPTIDDVNGNNVIIDGSAFVINGTFPTNVTSVKVIDGALETACSIDAQSGTSVNCAAYDAFSGNARFGTVSIEVSDGTDTDTHSITVVPGANYQYITLADPLIADGINKETTSADGDQVALEIVNGVTTTLYDDADVLFNPANANGTTLNRYAHDGSTWNADTITVYRGSVTDVSWTGTPSPPNPVIGEQYDYAFGGFVQGDRPITYTLETGQLPDGITIDSTAEKFTGIATSQQAFSNLTLKADNTAASVSVVVQGDDV